MIITSDELEKIFRRYIYTDGLPTDAIRNTIIYGMRDAAREEIKRRTNNARRRLMSSLDDESLVEILRGRIFADRDALMRLIDRIKENIDK